MKKFFKILMVFALLGGATLSCTKDYSKEIVDLKAQDENLKSTITALQNTVTALDGKIATLENNKADKTALESLKTTIEGEINTLKGRVSATEGDIADLKTLIGTIQTTITGIQGDITDLQGDIADLKIEDQNLWTAIHDLEDAVAVLEGKVEDLAARIQSIVAAAPTAEEVHAFTFGSKNVTNLEMAFEITPASLAKAITAENCEIIITEGLDITREATTPDALKAYKPATVKLNDKGEVVVNANINAKTNAESAYWVALKVKGQDRAGAIEKMSQFVKAVEGEDINAFDHLFWYDLSGATPVKLANPMTGAAKKSLSVSGPALLWKANVPAKATDAVIPVDYTDILSDYALMFDVEGKPWTIAEVAAKLGIEDFALTVEDAEKMVLNEYSYDFFDEGDAEFEIFQFTENGGLDIDFAAEFATDDDLTNREYVGLYANYHIPTIKIGEDKLPNFTVDYNVDIAGNTIHDKATEDQLLCKWDYVHYAAVSQYCHRFENVKWSGKGEMLWLSDYIWGTLYGYPVYDETDHRIQNAIGGVHQTAIDLFTFIVEGVPFENTAKNYYAGDTWTDTNAAGAPYTTYSIDIPFTVAAKHADVETALTAEAFVPNMTVGGTAEINEDICATIFSDLAAWTGNHTEATLADVKAAYIGQQKILTSEESDDVTLVIPATGDAYVAYQPAALEYGKDYTFTFTDETFGVGFEYTLTFSTKACPFSLHFTPIVVENNVLLAGQSEWFNSPNNGYYYTIDDAHFNKYIEVKNIADVPAGEIVTVAISEPTYLDEEGEATTALGAGQLHGTVLGSLAAKDETYGAFADGSVFDWGIDKTHKGFAGHSVKFELTLLAGEVEVESATITLNTEKPVITVTAKDCNVVRTPGENEVINLYEYLTITGLYDGFETELWSWNAVRGWHWVWNETLPSKDTPSYQAKIVLPTDVTTLDAKLNGVDFTLSAANARFEGNNLVLVSDNNPGVIEIDVPVKVTSVLDLNDPEKVGQVATIHVVAPLGE